MQREGPAQRGFPGGDHRNQRDGEKHRHRIVAAGFDLQRGADAFVQTFAPQEGEYRGGVGGTDNGADQQPLQQIEIEQPGGGHAGQTGGDHHTDGGERQRRPQGDAERADPGTHAAVEQDHRQREVADQISDGVIAEDDAAGAIDAGQHADRQEDHQDRNAEPGRK
ncbi:Uncharacterised protein [Klebsiella pneumoniae]|uniref:Uncharacterized protein n=1 Tax=Klebsiella pneumoniae TaxID=573 RepID=A0A2X1Q7Z0_KLEPN|nr:Uncharacterised protein [Klebsiella pneumoniae]